MTMMRLVARTVWLLRETCVPRYGARSSAAMMPMTAPGRNLERGGGPRAVDAASAPGGRTMPERTLQLRIDLGRIAPEAPGRPYG